MGGIKGCCAAYIKTQPAINSVATTNIESTTSSPWLAN